jgi:hypothetical protein
MADQNHWERQRREIDSYNLFYSSFPGVSGEQGLSDLDFKLPIRFPEVPIRGRTKDAEPDFMSFNGSTLLLAEVKSGSNLPDSYIRQMERCNAVTIEDAEEYLRDSDYFDDQGFTRGDISSIESYVIFNKERYDDRVSRHNSGELEELESYCEILSQSRGSMLKTERGEPDGTELRSMLDNGISLPKSPSSTVFLGEEIEKESLAVSICYDQIIPDLKHGPLELSASDIRGLYPNRSVSIQDIVDVMRFLDQINACSQISDRKYRFDDGNRRNAFGVKDIVSKQRVDEYLENIHDNQSGIDDF